MARPSLSWAIFSSSLFLSFSGEEMSSGLIAFDVSLQKILSSFCALWPIVLPPDNTFSAAFKNTSPLALCEWEDPRKNGLSDHEGSFSPHFSHVIFVVHSTPAEVAKKIFLFPPVLRKHFLLGR